MTSKELLYVEDALGHEQYLNTKCNEVISQINDSSLKNSVVELQKKHQQLFGSFMSLLN